MEILIIILLLHSTEAYKAAVFEYNPSMADSPENTILKNLESYRKQIQNAKDKGVDIIIFPEYGLTTTDVRPEEAAIKISNDTKVINELMAMASEYNMCIVVNLLEKDEKDYYNTNVVFDRDRGIVKKYRKINLSSNEQELKIKQGNESAIFRSSFGITFGLLTSLDILFQKPAEKVTDIIYTSAWKTYLPFSASLSKQHGYAIANGVNFLGASYHNPKEGYGGSGILEPDGNLSEFYLNDTTYSKLIIQEMKKLIKRKRTNKCKDFESKQHSTRLLQERLSRIEFKTEWKTDLSKYKFEDIDITKSSITQKICHENNFCCNFNINVSTPTSNENYKLTAYNGYETIDGIRTNIYVCSLLACSNRKNKTTCGDKTNFDYRTEFKLIEVTTTIQKNDTTMYNPVSAFNNLVPVTDSTYCHSNTTITFKLVKPQKNILVFGLFGANSQTNNKSGNLIIQNSSDNSAAVTELNNNKIACIVVFAVIVTVALP